MTDTRRRAAKYRRTPTAVRSTGNGKHHLLTGPLVLIEQSGRDQGPGGRRVAQTVCGLEIHAISHVGHPTCKRCLKKAEEHPELVWKGEDVG